MPGSIPKGRMALLFMVMLTTAAGNTAMQSVMPSIGTALGIADVWISLAYSWSALLWVICAPFWAGRSDRRGRKAMMALGMLGFIANLALIANVTMIIAILTMLGATLTLPGIAGIVLTVGMAVDSNVLIYERIREEHRSGRSLIQAIDAGFSKAFTTILDANVTTLIAAVILFYLGTGPVRGFAVTLGLGLITSVFTAIFVTRLMVVIWFERRRPKTLEV